VAQAPGHVNTPGVGYRSRPPQAGSEHGRIQSLRIEGGYGIRSADGGSEHGCTPGATTGSLPRREERGDPRLRFVGAGQAEERLRFQLQRLGERQFRPTVQQQHGLAHGVG
jgi:hypothetical protein